MRPWIRRSRCAILSVWLSACLILTGALAGLLWVDGGHATPEQWLYHALMERLGWPHHHGARAAPEKPAAPAGVVSVAGMPLHAPQIVAPAPPRVLPGPPAHLIIDPALAMLSPPPGGGVLMDETPHVRSIFLDPPDKPPRLVAPAGQR